MRVTGPGRRVTEYRFERGYLAGVIDPSGATTGVECDAAGLPVAVTSPDGAVTRYARDGFGRVTTITGPDGAATALAWTTEGRLTTRAFPDGTVERFAHDGEGNLTAHVSPAAGTDQARIRPLRPDRGAHRPGRHPHRVRLRPGAAADRGPAWRPDLAL